MLASLGFTFKGLLVFVSHYMDMMCLPRLNVVYVLF